MSDSACATDPTTGIQHDRDPDDPMVTVEDLKRHFPLFEDILQKKADEVRAIDSISFSIAEDETFSLVSEFGSSKATTGRSMPRLTKPTSGRVEIDSQNVVDLSDGELKWFRRNMQIVHQDSSSNLNPRYRAKSIIEAPLKIHDYGDSGARLERVEELLDMVDLPREFVCRYPEQSSGDQRQHVDIVRTVALGPKFTVLNEPTGVLDVSVQARIINILEEIQEEFGVTYLFITHDLSLLKNVADRIDVMCLGRLVEVGDMDSVFGPPQHPYSRTPLFAIPTIDEEDELAKPDRVTLDGEVSDPQEEPSGYAFRPRCIHEFDACTVEESELHEHGANQVTWCFLHDDRFEEGAEQE